MKKNLQAGSPLSWMYLIVNNPFFLKLYNNLIGRNHIHLHGNRLISTKVLMKRSLINIYGKHCIVKLCPHCELEDVTIKVYGDNNYIEIGESSYINKSELWIEDSNNRIVIGKKSYVLNKSHFACIEGTNITIGDECALPGITIHSGDGHSVLDKDGYRTNPSRDIVVGNHVWSGYGASINKGVHIGNDCIIAAGTIVTKSFEIDNILIGGIPGKVLKENINWDLAKINRYK